MTRPLHGWIRPDGSWLSGSTTHQGLAARELRRKKQRPSVLSKKMEKRGWLPESYELLLRGYVRIGGYSACGVEVFSWDRVSREAQAETEAALLEYGCSEYWLDQVAMEESSSYVEVARPPSRPLRNNPMRRKQAPQLRADQPYEVFSWLATLHREARNGYWEVFGIIPGADDSEISRLAVDPPDGAVGRLWLREQEINLYDGDAVRVLTVRGAMVDPLQRRRGVATAMYEHAARFACETLGVPLASDQELSDNALAFWEKQQRKGRAAFDSGRYIDSGRYVLTCPPPETLRNNMPLPVRHNSMHPSKAKLEAAVMAMRLYLGSVDFVAVRDQERLHKRIERHILAIADASGMRYIDVWTQVEDEATLRGILRPKPARDF